MIFKIIEYIGLLVFSVSIVVVGVFVNMDILILAAILIMALFGLVVFLVTPLLHYYKEEKQ